MSRFTALSIVSMIISALTAHVAQSQAAGAGGAPPAQGAAAAAAPARPPVAAVQASQWWCEVNAQPARGAQLTPEESARDFFSSQIIARPPRNGPDERKTVERLCRTAFEVQFGTRWDLLTARAQQAPTLEAAKVHRAADMRTGPHLGHTQDFRMSG